MNRTNAAKLTRHDQWFRYWLPYGFRRIEVGGSRHIYLPLNRDHKPLGVTSGETVDYEEFASHAIEFSSDPHGFPEVWFSPDDLYLYNDNPGSRQNYFERLERLMSRSLPLFDMDPVRRA